MSPKTQLVVEAIRNGTVIDHIPAERTIQLVELLKNGDDPYFMGVNLSSTSTGKKGILKLINRKLKDEDFEILAALAPGATVNIIEDYSIIEKRKPSVPEEVFDLFICPNSRCITNHERVTTRFRLGSAEHTCCYCERSFAVHRLTTRRGEQ